MEDPRYMSAQKDFKVSVSCKVARLPRGSGEIEYFNYPDVTPAIIGNASTSATPFGEWAVASGPQEQARFVE